MCLYDKAGCLLDNTIVPMQPLTELVSVACKVSSEEVVSSVLSVVLSAYHSSSPAFSLRLDRMVAGMFPRGSNPCLKKTTQDFSSWAAVCANPCRVALMKVC